MERTGGESTDDSGASNRRVDDGDDVLELSLKVLLPGGTERTTSRRARQGSDQRKEDNAAATKDREQGCKVSFDAEERQESAKGRTE